MTTEKDGIDWRKLIITGVAGIALNAVISMLMTYNVLQYKMADVVSEMDEAVVQLKQQREDIAEDREAIVRIVSDVEHMQKDWEELKRKQEQERKMLNELYYSCCPDKGLSHEIQIPQ